MEQHIVTNRHQPSDSDKHIGQRHYHQALVRLYNVGQQAAYFGKYQEVRGQGGRYVWVHNKRFWVPLAYAQMERVDET